MVDELVVYTNRPPFHRGSCHLATDGDDLEELHTFAERIGLRRAWFQPKSSPHYDLVPSKRAAALAAGAVFVPGKVQARMRIAKRLAP